MSRDRGPEFYRRRALASAVWRGRSAGSSAIGCGKPSNARALNGEGACTRKSGVERHPPTDRGVCGAATSPTARRRLPPSRSPVDRMPGRPVPVPLAHREGWLAMRSALF